jgi:hypothetical protein
VSWVFLQCVISISAMCHEYFLQCHEYFCNILMTHCRNTHNTLQKYSWHIAEILMTHDCRNIHDTLQKYSWNIAKILMTYYKNTHDIAKNIHDTLQKYWWQCHEYFCNVSWVFLQCVMSISAMCHQYFCNMKKLCHEYFCNMSWVFLPIFHEYFCNVSWIFLIAEILITHCRNTHDTLKKYSWHMIAEIFMTHCRNTHDTWLQKYSWHIAEIFMYFCNVSSVFLQYEKIMSWVFLPIFHEYFCNVSWIFLQSCIMRISAMSHEYLEILMTHCRNTHDTLQKYSWHIAEIFMTHDCRNIHDTLQKYAWYMIAVISSWHKHIQHIKSLEKSEKGKSKN